MEIEPTIIVLKVEYYPIVFKYCINIFNFRSIRQEQLDEINSVLERDFMIRAIHDVKGIDIGSNLIRYKVFVSINRYSSYL